MSICSECGGECCKNSPGIYYPSQVDLTNGLPENCIIDYWYMYDEEDIYFLRPQTTIEQELSKMLSGFSRLGVCVYHTNKGCSLNKQERPIQCVKLKPHVDGYKKCYSPKKYWTEQVKDIWNTSEIQSLLRGYL